MKLKIYICFIIEIIYFFSVSAWSENIQEITPTDVYYLAKSIDDSLVAKYNLTSEFNKKMLSNNIRPRSSYQKLISVADEFNLLHGDVIDQNQLNILREIDPLTTRPGNLYDVLILIKDYLVSQDKFVEFTGTKTPKTPSDVTHLLRQISFHHIEIAKQKNIITNWSTPEQVYDAVIRDILPIVKGVADEVGLEYEDYPFYKQPMEDIIPRNVAKLLQHLYKNIAEYYKNKGWYDPLVLIEVNDCDDISPGDSFDLIKAISAEFKAMSGNKRLSPDTEAKYNTWKTAKTKIVPGDVYRLLQYNYVLSKRALKKSERR